jgi:hypothetical protein
VATRQGGRRRVAGGVGWVILALGATVAADEPLRSRIDRAIESKLDGPVAATATDGEFLRRVSLDLAGVVPTSAEARAFLDDPSPYKRERLIDAILDSPRYARRMQYVFDVMLMERRADANNLADRWQDYLRRSFRENKPYNQLVREILAADGLDPAARPAARFWLDREAEPYLMTRDIGRIFLGRDMQCAQCHDHPLVDDYKQAHYYGLFAFVGRTSLFADPARGNVLAEKGDGDVSFTSVFKKKVKNQTGPRILDGPPVPEPDIAKGREYAVPPADKVRPVPSFSRRAQLSPALTSGNVPEFDRNIVNRLWAMMMGRGLVHPLDFHHGDNPPSHPELLDDLARSFAESGYDVKAFLRELALTRTYQRSSEPPPGMSPSQQDPALYAVAALKPLSPEQLGWSVMQSLGVMAAYRDEAVARFDQLDPKAKAFFSLDEKRRALRDELIEDEVVVRLSPSLGPFLNQFAGAAGQPQDASDPTVHQALFLSNGEPVQSWLAPSGTNLTARLAALADPGAVAEELYLSVLSRRPTEEERAEVAQYLESRKDQRPAALKELAWSLLASSEFRFNH